MLMPDPRGPLNDDDIDEAYAWPAQPWLRANMVATVDGAAHSAGGTSRGISSDSDRKLFGALRGLTDVIVVGAQTARAEKYRPAMPKPEYAERRSANGQSPAPTIAIVSRSLDLPLESSLFTERGDGIAAPIVITTLDADPVRRHAIPDSVEVLEYGEGRIDLSAALGALRRRGLGRIHCEGGPHLLGELIAAGLLDELCLTISPRLVGSTTGELIGRVAVPPARTFPDVDLTVGHLLEADGSLFARYLVNRRNS